MACRTRMSRIGGAGVLSPPLRCRYAIRSVSPDTTWRFNAAREHFRDLRLKVGNVAYLQLVDFRLCSWTVLEVVSIALQTDILAARMLVHSKRSGADRLFIHAEG